MFLRQIRWLHIDRDLIDVLNKFIGWIFSCGALHKKAYGTWIAHSLFDS